MSILARLDDASRQHRADALLVALLNDAADRIRALELGEPLTVPRRLTRRAGAARECGLCGSPAVDRAVDCNECSAPL